MTWYKARAILSEPSRKIKGENVFFFKFPIKEEAAEEQARCRHATMNLFNHLLGQRKLTNKFTSTFVDL